MEISRADLGESLHTGLRKGCDSTWSSLMYTAINLVSPETWEGFLTILDHNFKKSGVSEETLLYVFKEIGSFDIWKWRGQQNADSQRELEERERKFTSEQHGIESMFFNAANLITKDDAESLMGWFKYIDDYYAKSSAGDNL